MVRIDQAWLEFQHSRFMRPDADRFIRPSHPNDHRHKLNHARPAESVGSLIVEIKSLLAELILLKRQVLARKAGFKPGQPRVPKGSPGGGQWSGDGASASGSKPDSPAPTAPMERPARRMERVGKVRELARWLSRIPAVGLAIQAYAGFESEIDSPDNLVRIPRMKHWEITGWYGRANDEFGGLSPREYLIDKDWSERRRVGIFALSEHKVLLP